MNDVTNVFLANLGHLIFKIFLGEHGSPDSAPLAVPFFGICIYLRIRLLMQLLSKLVLCGIPKISYIKILSALIDRNKHFPLKHIAMISSLTSC